MIDYDKILQNAHAIPADLKMCRLLDGFMKRRQVLVQNTLIPYQWKILNDQIPDIEPSGAIHNFLVASGKTTGKFYGRPFQDSDVYKWLEAVAYCLMIERDADLENLADEAIDIIADAQQPDGYLDTLYIINNRLCERWTNIRDNHELYCAGHLIEAAVAYFNATEKRKILDVACKLADHICSVLGPEEGQIHGYPGHEEIELALVKLYRVTENKKYLLEAKYFIEERGSNSPLFFDAEAEKRGNEEKPYGPSNGVFTYEYNQSHQPIKEQKKAVGHAVRALYLYSGITDYVIETRNKQYYQVLYELWNNVTTKQMYITGAVGASQFGESFTVDYDLPPDTAYCETCASVALMMWAQRMFEIHQSSSYIDVLERVLYNGVLPSMSDDGKHFFYVNPLEVWPDSVIARNDKKRTALLRKQWFTCSCCPPNVARTLSNLASYCYMEKSEAIYVNLYINSVLETDDGFAIKQNSNMPWEGDIQLSVESRKPQQKCLFLRIPDWCNHNYHLYINNELIYAQEENGFLTINRLWTSKTSILLQLEILPFFVYPSPEIRSVNGKVAIQRGPLVYCMEETDNGKRLTDIRIEGSEITEYWNPNLSGGVIELLVGASRSQEKRWNLYARQEPTRERIRAHFIPYFSWNNRGIGEMTVFVLK